MNTAAPTPESSIRLVALAFAALLLACLWLSWPAVNGPFLFDDFPNLVRLALVEGELDANHIGRYLAEFPGTPGRPLSALTFLINDYAWPSQPESFKHTNLMLHLLAGVMVFGFARALSHAAALPGPPDAIALLVLAAWLLHPLQLSTSMLVVQRMTLLSALFSFAGLWAYVAIARRARRASDGFAAIAALGAATLLAVLCKENGALTPLLACVLNVTLLRPTLAAAEPGARRWLLLGSALPVLVLLLAIASMGMGSVDFGSRNFSMGERLLTQARVLLDYLHSILLPRLGGGGLFHDDFEISRGLLAPATTLPAVLAVVILLGAGWATRRRLPLFSFSVLWFFAGHVLESSVFPLEIYFEHRNYLPMFGPLFGLAAWALGSVRHRRVFIGLALVWLAMAAFMTRSQATVWGNEAMIAEFWALENPESPRALQQYASYLERSGRPEKAVAVLMDAHRRVADTPDFPVQALKVVCSHDLPIPSPDFIELIAASTRDGGYTHSMFGTLSLLREMVERDLCPELLDDARWWALSDALLANPNYVGTLGPSYFHVERAYLRQHQGDLDGTIREYEEAFRLRPSIQLSQVIATTFLSAGLTAEAIEWLERGLALPARPVKTWLSPADEQSRQLLAILRGQPPITGSR